MKRFVCVLLCIVFACTLLVSCGERVIGKDLEKYDPNSNKVENLTLNLYIVVGDGTSESAEESVARELNAHTLSKFNTTLRVHYVAESQYQTTVLNAISAGGSDTPHIILINSVDMFNSLIGSGTSNKLLELNSYLDSNAYGSLNTQIPEALINGSRVDGRLYTIPNNYLIGEYEYLVINKALANHYLYNDTKLSSYKTLEDAAQLRADMLADGLTEQEVNAAVFMANGPYEMRAEKQSEGYICNVSKYPEVTPEIAFRSAFAIVKNIEEKYHSRAMQIIYEINNNVEFRNLLQYGVKDTHYTIENGVVTRLGGDNAYNMNLLYTGDVFKAYYCEELGWNETNYNNWFNQNEESVTQ